MTEQVPWSFNIHDRVTWTSGPAYGVTRGEGVVYGQLRDPLDGRQLFNIRWDDPGLDDEMIDGRELDKIRRVLPDQIPPLPNDLPHVADLVKSDIDARRAKGIATYGQALQPMNNRSALQDLYEELLDAAQYVRQRLEEEATYLAQLAADDGAGPHVAQIRELASGIRQNAPETSAAHDLALGTLYLLRLLDAQAHQLRKATQALVRAEHPPADLEVAGLQFRVMGPDGEPEYDSSHDWDEIADWAHGRYTYYKGHYPEFRPVYGGAWRPVTPGKPPEIPEGHYAVPKATEPPAASPSPPETSIAPSRSLPYLIRRARLQTGLTQHQLASTSGVTQSRLIQIQNYYVRVFGDEITRLADALHLTEKEVDHLLDLALESEIPQPCPVDTCRHAPSQHTRADGCKRCTCRYGRVIDEPDLTGSQIP